MQYCEHCNVNYPDSAQFCSTCGKKLVFRPEKVNRQKVLSVLRSLPGYKKILQNCTIYNYDEKVYFDYIVVHESGVFLFQFYERFRILEGNDKMRYWTAEDSFNGGTVIKIERPVTQLEKDHSLLDQVLRRYTFTKSFAFLIFPSDSGLEKVKSVYTDQMLTLLRMGSILLKNIDSYGHAYDKQTVDKVYDILSGLASRQEIPHPDQIEKSKQIHKKNKSTRIAAILVILCVSALSVYFIFLKGQLPGIIRQTARSPIQTEAPVYKPSPPAQSNVYTLSGLCSSLYNSIDESSFYQTAAALGCRVLKYLPGEEIQLSLPIGSEPDICNNASTLFQDKVDNLFSDKLLPHFTSVRINDHSQFTIFVTGEDTNSKEDNLISEMFRLGVFLATLEGRSPETFFVVFLSQTGQEINTITLENYLSSH